MKRFLFLGISALTLAACTESGVPDSGGGVGFGDYSDYQARREAELLGNTPNRAAVPPPAGVVSSNLDNADPAIAAAERALGRGSDDLPFDAAPGNAAPQVVSNAVGMSDENDFDAVSGERDIAADAALIARNRAQYQVIQPTELPSRTGAEGPNIVEYAIKSTNPRGTPLYRRSAFNSEAKAARACADYSSSDLAQEAFLAGGGPERDRRGMDPDGDGFACGWDPEPYRSVSRN